MFIAVEFALDNSQMYFYKTQANHHKLRQVHGKSNESVNCGHSAVTKRIIHLHSRWSKTNERVGIEINLWITKKRGHEEDHKVDAPRGSDEDQGLSGREHMWDPLTGAGRYVEVHGYQGLDGQRHARYLYKDTPAELTEGERGATMATVLCLDVAVALQ